MTSEPDGEFASGRHLLPILLARVVQARAHELRELREPGARAEPVREARLDTLLALRVYADAIEALSWPVPRTIRLEIRLHQALVGPTVAPWPREDTAGASDGA